MSIQVSVSCTIVVNGDPVTSTHREETVINPAQGNLEAGIEISKAVAERMASEVAEVTSTKLDEFAEAARGA